MRPKFGDLQDQSDGFFDASSAWAYTSFLPPSLAGSNGGGTSGDTTVEIPETPALTAEAVASSSAQGSLGSALALTSGGITINLLFDTAAMAAPASFRAGIQQAASILTATISDHITVNIKIDYSGVGGGAAAGPDSGYYETYSSIRSDLINAATPGDTIFNALPAGASIQGQSNVAVWNAQLKLFGILGANDTTTDDGSATFATDINSNLLVGVALHELTHAMGRIPYGTSPDIFDLFRFTSAGTMLFNGASKAPAAYFSIDGGNTKLADYGQTSDPSDFLNSGVQGYNDPFDEYYSGGTLQSLTTADKLQLDALGFHTAAPVTTKVIEAFGSTSLTQIGSEYYLYNAGTGPVLKNAGTPTLAGSQGAWVPVGAEQVTGGGYEVAWKNGAADQYMLWNTDSNGNTLSIGSVVTGNSTTLEAAENLLHQDLNGDGVIGIPTTTVIEASGTTHLTQVGLQYDLFDGNGSGPVLKYSGSPVLAGQQGAWVAIGAEQVTGGGYEVAWKNGSADQYIIWNTDSSGNFLSMATGVVTGSSTALESAETTFHQDLNGDGTIGVPNATAMVIEAFGSTSLAQVGSAYYLYTSGTGPSVKYAGVPILAGQQGAWVPIGAEQVTGGGYEVAWKNGSADQYIIWNTDSSGNFVSMATGVVTGSSTALVSAEATFHQDLNGDGTIGVAGTVIEAFGSTHLTQIGLQYDLLDSNGSGPVLKYASAPILAGSQDAWAAIGAEQVTGGGYEVAWKYGSADQYIIWNTDSSGNFLSMATAVVTGSSTALESAENIFHQDLNADGVTGIYAAPATTLQIGTPLAGASGSATIGAGATLDLAASDSGSVTFAGATGTLVLETPSTFSGTIFNFTGNGVASSSDQIDLKGFNFASVQASYANGLLTVTDGTHTAGLNFNGSWLLANFKFSNDGHGGTLLIDPPVAAADPATDSFAFHPAAGYDGRQASNDNASLEGLPSILSHPQWMSQPVNGGNDAIAGLGHDSLPQTEVHMADLHASGFMFH